MEKKEKANTFLIVLFIIILIVVLLFPKIYGFIQKSSLPKIKKVEIEDKKEEKVIDADVLETVHFPIMRNSIYDANTYYSLDTFTINNMSNQDILYNAFMDIYEGNITNSSVGAKCSNISKEFNEDYLILRIKNILGKNVNYTLEDFYVPEDSDSSYTGSWIYNGSKYVYDGLCSSKATNTKYYNLEEQIKAEFDGDDIVIYYYVGFAKVDGNNYTIYKDANMTEEIDTGTFVNVDQLKDIFKGLSGKKIYRYTFKDTLCSYNDYCLYEGKWVNEL